MPSCDCVCVCVQVHYWAVDADCCPEGGVSCAGWRDEGWLEAVHWDKQDRPSAVFLRQEHFNLTEVFKTIADKRQSSEGVFVALQWQENALAYIASLYDVPAWVWLVGVSLLWPLVLLLLYTAVTLGSCIFLPR